MPAPNVTTAEMAAALGVIAASDSTLSAEESAQVERVRLAAAALVVEVAPGAPQAIANEAAVRVAGYLFDSDPSASGRAPRDLLASSGASALLSRWRVKRVLAPKTAAAGDAPAPSGGVNTAAVELLIQEALAAYAPVDQTARDAAAAAQTKADEPDVDQTARDAAAAAQMAAAAAQTKADEPDVDQTARDAAAAAQTTADAAATSAALDARVPAPTKAHAGRLLAVGSDGDTFWDRARDALVRALGPLAGQAGKVVGINAEADDIVLVDAAGAGRDDTARASAAAAAMAAAENTKSLSDNAMALAANRGDIDSLLALGLNFTDVSLVKHLPAAHTFTPSNTVAVYFVTAHTYAGLDSAAKYRALAWQTTATQRNLRNGGRMLVRVPIGDVDAESFTRGYILHLVDGQPTLAENFRQIPLSEQFRDSDFAYFATLEFSIHRKQDGNGYDHTWRYQDYSITVAIDAAHLAAAVAARLLPAGGDDGQLVGRAAGAPAWVAAPSGGGVTVSAEVVQSVTSRTKGNAVLVNLDIPAAGLVSLRILEGSDHQHFVAVPAAVLRGLTASTAGSGLVSNTQIGKFENLTLVAGRTAANKLLLQRLGSDTDNVLVFAYTVR